MGLRKKILGEAYTVGTVSDKFCLFSFLSVMYFLCFLWHYFSQYSLLFTCASPPHRPPTCLISSFAFRVCFQPISSLPIPVFFSTRYPHLCFCASLHLHLIPSLVQFVFKSSLWRVIGLLSQVLPCLPVPLVFLGPYRVFQFLPFILD